MDDNKELSEEEKEELAWEAYIEERERHPERFQPVSKPGRVFLRHPRLLDVIDWQFKDGKRFVTYTLGRTTVTAITPEQDQIDVAKIARRLERG